MSGQTPSTFLETRQAQSTSPSQRAVTQPVLQTANFGVAILALPGILLALLCLLPYLNKAYTIDDPRFLLEARQITKTPLQPMAFPICWNYENCVKSAASDGPGATQALMGYALVPVVLMGSREWLAHLVQLFFVSMAVVAMVRLALRLGCNRLAAAGAGLLMVAIPPFMPMASTAMPDIMALSLGLAGIERLLAWKDGRQWHQATAAVLALGLAPYARPHMALLLPLAALWLFDDFLLRNAFRQLRRDVMLWSPLFMAVLLLVAVNVLTRQREYQNEHGINLVLMGMTLPNLFAYFLYLAFPIPFAGVWISAHLRKAPLLLIAPVIPIAIMHLTLFPSQTWTSEWSTLGAVYGLTAVMHYLFQQCWKKRDRIGILLGVWVLVPLPLVIYIHLPAKYMLSAFPAVVLIIVRTLSTMPRRRAAMFFSATTVTCAVYSALILRADADFAEYGRRAAAELIAPHTATGEKVWYGGQWGFYWYAAENGARLSKPGAPGPKPGDLLAVGLMENGDITMNRFPNRELVDSRVYASPHGRTMGSGAGLYSNFFGMAMWTWSPKATNTYQLWRIK